MNCWVGERVRGKWLSIAPYYLRVPPGEWLILIVCVWHLRRGIDSVLFLFLFSVMLESIIISLYHYSVLIHKWATVNAQQMYAHWLTYYLLTGKKHVVLRCYVITVWEIDSVISLGIHHLQLQLHRSFTSLHLDIQPHINTTTKQPQPYASPN